MLVQPVVSVSKMTVVLGGKIVLDGIDFAVGAGDLVGVIGPNGAGKTTLLRALLGLISPAAGAVKIFGVSQKDLSEIRSQIGYMPQLQSFEKNFPLSVADVVATGLLAPSTMLRPIKNKGQRADEALEAVGMAEYAKQPFQDLSGGQQQRVLLARSLVRRPRLLLLDEPNAGLDFKAQQIFMELLKKLKREDNLAIILVSHDLISIADAADRLLCINRTMHVHGSPTEVLHSPDLDLAYRCQFDFFSGLTATMEREKNDQ